MHPKPKYRALACSVITLAALTPVRLAAGPLFSDDFTEGIQPHWSPIAEQGGASGATEGPGQAKPGSLLVTGNSGWTDYRLSAQLRTVEQDDVIGLVFAYKDKGNYYRIVLDRQQGTRRLEKAVNGAVEVLAQDSFTFDDTVRYAVEAKLDRGAVEVSVDGNQVFRVNDVSHNSGKVGLYSQAPLDSWSNIWSRFDAVKVTDGSEAVQTAAVEAEAAEAWPSESLAFDWNGICNHPYARYVEGKTPSKPNNPPVRANGDWTLPPDYAHGTYHVRVLVRHMKGNDAFKLLYNHWQYVNGKLAETTMVTDNLQFHYSGKPITRTFSYPLTALKDQHLANPVKFAAFNWRVPRQIVGFFAASRTASDKALNALPLDIRFTVVVVGKGKTFSGWGKY